MDHEARRTILARRAGFVATALSGLTVSTSAIAQTRAVPEEPKGEDPLAKQRALATAGGARFGVGAEAIATTTGAESAGGEGGGIAYVGWGDKLHFRALLLARAGGTDDGLVLPLGAGLGARLFYARQPGLELGVGLSLSGGYLFAPGERRELDTGPFLDARFEPTVFRLDGDLGDFGVFFGVRFARRIDEDPGFGPVTGTLGATYSFTFSGSTPEPPKQARNTCGARSSSRNPL